MLNFMASFTFQRYSIDKRNTDRMYSISLHLNLYIDDECNTFPIIKEVKLPIPICNVDYQHFVLPGDGTVAGFVDYLDGRVGDVAIDFVVEKYEMKV